MKLPSPVRFLAPALASLALAGPVWAEQGDWQSVGIGGGGGIFVPASSPHDPDLLFCASDMSGAYRSTDGGRTWRMLNWREISSAIVCPVIFHPTDPNVMYWISGPWAKPLLKVSRDKGLTWKPLTEQTPWHASTPQYTTLAIGPAGKVLLVSSEKGTFRSEDEGHAWKQVEGIDERPGTFFFEPAQGGKYWYAASFDHIRRSDDQGRTWKDCPGELPGRPVNAVCGGTDPKTGKVVLYCVIPSRDEGDKFAGGIFRSDDRGASWRSAMGEGLNVTIGRHGPVTRTVAQYVDLGMAGNQTDTVYAYCYGTGNRAPYSSTVYRTDDGGKRWHRVLVGPRYADGQNVDLGWINYERGWGEGMISFYVNPRHKDVVHFSSAMEIFVTYDGGKRWRQAYTRCAEGEGDAGKPWSGTGLEMTTTWRYVFDPHDPKRTYICYTDIGFARSLDRGGSWYNSVAGSPWANTFYDIAFDPARPGVIYAACAYEHDIPSWKVAGTVAGGGGVCLSTNWGQTWLASAKGMPVKGACTAVELDPGSPQERRILYASIYGGGVYKSADSGKAWTARNEGLRTDSNDHFTDLKLHKDGTLFALCGAKKSAQNQPIAYGGLFKSADGGQSWTDLIEGLKLYHPYGFDVHPADSRIIYLCASAVPGHHAQDGVYKSTDGGKSWKRLEIEQFKGSAYSHPKYPSIDPYRPERVWLSTGVHGLLVSTDAGQTWREVRGVPFCGINRVTVDPRDHETIWCSSFGGGIWRGPAEEGN